MIGLFLAFNFSSTLLSPGSALAPNPPVEAPVTLMDTSGCKGFSLLARDEGHARFKRLGDLPDANMEVAVNQHMGCAALPVVTRYKVSR